MLNGRFLASHFAQLLRGMARNDNFYDLRKNTTNVIAGRDPSRPRDRLRNLMSEIATPLVQKKGSQ